ncbi:MAG: M48 family metalloprotease [Bryobacterales bacterium]|nr:M48 family metalloprotease [Bryobacterales bacterium]
MRLLAFALVLLVPASMFGQFGGLVDKARRRIEQSTAKAKPVTDRAVRAADTFVPWSADEEQEIGVATAARLVAMFGLVEDEALAHYVNLVGATVARHASRQVPYRFGILDTEIVGAFALPGGFVFITRGALAGMKNEAQLAGALSHEIVHIAERHLETSIRSRRTSNWAIEEAKAEALGNVMNMRQKTDAFLKDMFYSGLSRDKENAADEHGTQLAIRSGYAAHGLVSFLEAMAESNTKEENRRLFGQLLTTHPPFDARIEALMPVVTRSAAEGKTLEERFLAHVH